MSKKVAAEDTPKAAAETAAVMEAPKVAGKTEATVVVREYDEERDKVGVEELEKSCEFGVKGKPSIVTDLMGDPLCRIRLFPSHIMLVAECGEERMICGVIRGCIKTVTRGTHRYVKLAYVLGLRVSPAHRRLGIGTKLVHELEEWCKQKGAEYAYMATDCTNKPSLNLFTQKCSYSKFRTPTMLVQPVHAHHKPISSKIAIVGIHQKLAQSIYQQIFAKSEFFPKDIDLILSNKLHLGTFMAIPKNDLPKWDPKSGILPPNFAILSVWNTREVFKLQVKGASKLTYAYCRGTRLFDSCLPWLRLPSIPDVFKKFGVYFLYGLHMQGHNASQLMKTLCGFVHNMARDDVGCGAIVAEVGHRDPVKEAIPHWRRFSLAEDFWCIKKFKDATQLGHYEKCDEFEPSDWITSRPLSPVIFVDPRDI